MFSIRRALYRSAFYGVKEELDLSAEFLSALLLGGGLMIEITGQLVMGRLSPLESVIVL